MKYAALGLVFALAGVSSAQSFGIDNLVRAAMTSGAIKFQQTLPMGEKLPPLPKSVPLPPAPDNPNALEVVHYGDVKANGNDIELTNGAEIITHGYRCLAETIKGNKETQIFTCSGDVRIIGTDSTLVGESVTINFKNKTFFATYGKAQIKPNLLQNQVTGDVFLSGKEAYGTSKKIFGQESSFTTCNKEVPHFHLDSESSTIEPGREAILKKVDIVILGHKVLSLPVLWIPLGDRSFKYLPQVGQSPDEGYYIKNTYGFPMRGDDRGAIRVDYMSKLGLGLGANYYYRNKNMNGVLKGYGIFGNSKTFLISSQHEQRLGWADLLVDTDIQNNNYLSAPGTTTVNNRVQLKFPKFTSFSFSQQAQSSSAFSSYNQTTTITDARVWGKFNSNFDVTLNRSGGSAGVSRETADVRILESDDVKKGVVSLEYQRSIPIGDVSNFFPSSDKTPVLAFKTDSNRLYGPNMFKTLPFRMEVTVGEYLDPILKERISRTSFDFGFNRATRDKGNWRWDFNGDFHQNLYSDNTAQYKITLGQNLTYAIAKQVTFNVRYSYFRPFGYSPLAIDQGGQTNILTSDVSFQKNSKSSFGIQTGYDFIRGSTGQVPWQQIGIRSEYKLGGAYSFRTLTSYDTFSQKWSNVRLDSTWQTPTLNATVGARYDGIQHTWSTVNVNLDGLESGKTRIGTVLNFNGYTQRFDSQQYNIVYDLHCAEAILTIQDFGTGFRAGKEIGFFIRLKSIPFDSNFGRGRLGQALGSGTGRDF